MDRNQREAARIANDRVGKRIEAATDVAEMVNHPRHYKTASGLEAIDVMEAYDLGFHLGNAMKYLLRAGRKGDRLEDLSKAQWYIQRWRVCVKNFGPELEERRSYTRPTPARVVSSFGIDCRYQAGAIRDLLYARSNASLLLVIAASENLEKAIERASR